MLMEFYNAARQAAAVVEQNWMGEVKLTGADRIAWLQGMVTNDLQKLHPGEGCYAAHLSAQGKLVAQMVVLLDEDAVRLVLESAAIGGLVSAFDRLIVMEDVQVGDESGQYSMLRVIGPSSRAVLESCLGEPLNLDGLYRHRQLGDYRVVRSDLAYDLWVPHESVPTARRALVAAGAAEIDQETWNLLRTEAGL